MPTPIVEGSYEKIQNAAVSRFIREYVDWNKERVCPRCQSVFILDDEDKKNVQIGSYSRYNNAHWVHLDVQCPVCTYNLYAHDCTDGIGAYVPVNTQEPVIERNLRSNVPQFPKPPSVLFVAGFILAMIITALVLATLT